jgi:hypothetical protein
MINLLRLMTLDRLILYHSLVLVLLYFHVIFVMLFVMIKLYIYFIYKIIYLILYLLNLILIYTYI